MSLLNINEVNSANSGQHFLGAAEETGVAHVPYHIGGAPPVVFLLAEFPLLRCSAEGQCRDARMVRVVLSTKHLTLVL